VSVYVDDADIAATVGRHTSRWSHLTADTKDELHEFAAKLGLKRSYFQVHDASPLCRGGEQCPHWHYDVTAPKRARALQLGAQPIDRRALAALLAARRAAMRPPIAAPPAGPVRPAVTVTKGECSADDPPCRRPARLYPGGWRCDDDAPGVARQAATGANRPADPPPAGKRRPRYNPTSQRHSWDKLKEHHKRCGFCGVHVMNHTENHRDWWQTWTWPDGSTGSNQAERSRTLPKCPGPTSEAS
jgi:hypothetical protein